MGRDSPVSGGLDSLQHAALDQVGEVLVDGRREGPPRTSRPSSMFRLSAYCVRLALEIRSIWLSATAHLAWSEP